MTKKGIKKELREWLVLITVLLTLYLTGLHTNVAAFAQRVILSTGLITANTELMVSEQSEADFNFSFKTLEGEELKLSQFKGKVIFMNMWATWCAPCIAEMPSIQSLYEKVDHEDVVFVMVSLDKTLSKPQKFIEKKGYTFPVYMPAAGLPEVFESPSIPTTFVISKEGKIISKKVGMANYDKKSFYNFLIKEADK